MKSTIESTQGAVQTVKELSQDIKEDASDTRETSEALVWVALWFLLCGVIALTSFGVALVVSTVTAWVVAGLVGLASVGWFATRFKKHLLDDGEEKPKKQKE